MTYDEFYDLLATLSISAPNFEVAKAALQLQVALDKLNAIQLRDFEILIR
jgi:hypothetical protein